MELTESVRSFHVPATPGTTAWPPSLPSVPTSRATRVTSAVNTPKLLNHGVDDVRGAQELAFQRAAIHVEPDGSRQVALGHGGNGVRDFRRGPKQVLNQRVDGDFHVVPRAAALLNANPFAGLAFFADRLANALQLQRHLFVSGHNLIEAVGDLAGQPRPGDRQAHAEVAVLHGLKTLQNDGKVLGRGRLKSAIALGKILLPAFPRDGLRCGYFHLF